MTDALRAAPSSAAELTQALLAVKLDHELSTVTLDSKGRIVAEWFLATMGSTMKTARYRITLIGETGQYKAWLYEYESPNTVDAGQLFPAYSYSFQSRDLSDPIDAVLAAHGWVRARSAASRFFRRLLGKG